MVQTVKSSLNAHLSGGDHRPLELQLASFLLQYRNTPHSTTGVAPVEALMGRKMRTQLDLLKPQPAEKVLDAQAQQMMNHSQKLPEYEAGDKVLVRNYSGGSKWKKGAVLGHTGPVSYEVTVEGLVWSRHAGQLLPLSTPSFQNKEAQESGNQDTPPLYQSGSNFNQRTKPQLSSDSARRMQHSSTNGVGTSTPPPDILLPQPDLASDADRGIEEDADRGIEEDADRGIEEDADRGNKEDADRGNGAQITSEIPSSTEAPDTGDRSNPHLSSIQCKPEDTELPSSSAEPGSTRSVTMTGRNSRKPRRFEDYIM